MATYDPTSGQSIGHTAASVGITHVGLTVPDLDRAINWYGEILGWSLMMGPVEVTLDDDHVGHQILDVFGPGIGRFRQAHMSVGNGVAVELFEFLEPSTPKERPDFDYWRPGVFHVCIVATDIEKLADRISATGGRLRTSKIWAVFPDEPFRMCYCEDPFGNVIELYSHTHDEVFAGRSGY